MRKCVNGVYMDMTQKEVDVVETIYKPEYKERVVSRIREVYSMDDEIAILRQKDTKPEEFNEYNALVEKIKEEEREENE